MRITSKSLLAIASVLALATVGTAASAAGSDKSSHQAGEGGAAGAGAGAGGSSGSAGASAESFRDSPLDADMGVDKKPAKKKPWEVAGGFEYHRLWRRNDLGGAAVNSDVNVYSLAGAYDLTEHDRLRLRGFLYERFLADEGETGVRTDDLILSYTRTIPVAHPKIEPHDDGEVVLKPGAWVTAPTSFYSKKASIITVPRIYFSAEKTFLGWLHVEPRISGDWYFVRYRTYEGGATPNTKARLGGGLNVEANVPFHRPLTFGLDVGTAYYWYYAAYGSEALSTTKDPNFPGVVQDGTYKSQPIQQTYGGEIYARYEFPSWKDVKSDVTLALANGDPTIGYVSAIHEGARFFYLGYRQTAEVYGALAIRY